MRASKRMWKGSIFLICMVVVCGCAVIKTPVTLRIALLAPFEGRYREIGYNALYAARLAFSDVANAQFEFLPIDDGGTFQRAVERARAMVLDPRIVAVVAMGYQASAPETLEAFADVPVLIVGNWSTSPESGTVMTLSNPALNAQITARPYDNLTNAAELETPIVGGEVFSLRSFVRLSDSLDEVTVASSGSLPDPEFAQRYRESDPFAPEAGLLATLTYDAVAMILQANQTDRAQMNVALHNITYEGLNGTFRFIDGYWDNAPIHLYRYENRELVLAEDIIEER